MILPQVYTDKHGCQLSEIVGDAYFLHRSIYSAFPKFFDGIAVALGMRGDKFNCNDQTTLQARTKTTQGWSSI